MNNTTGSDSRTARHVLVVVGTRPEAIKLAPVVHALRTAEATRVTVLSTGQHRGMLDQTLRFFDICADRDLDIMRPEQTLAGLTSRLMAAIDPVLDELRPDVIVAQGDTTTVMVGSLASFYRRIPFAHVEAGLRTGDIHSPFPEEANRRITGQLARWHFAPTSGARDNLLRERIEPSSIHVTGNTVIDALGYATRQPLTDRFDRDARPMLLVTAHRRENFGAPLERICAAIRELVAARDVRVVFPVHLNPNVQSVVRRTLSDHPRIDLCEPLDYPDLVAAMRASTLILTDSGGVQEEAPSLGKPVLVLRETTERPEGVAAGVARLVGADLDLIVTSALRLLDDPVAYAEMAQIANPYGDGRAAARIVDVLRREA